MCLVGSRERKWAVLALVGAAQEQLLDGRIYEGFAHCQMRDQFGCRIADLGDLGALAGLGFKVRMGSSGPAYAFTAASLIPYATHILLHRH